MADLNTALSPSPVATCETATGQTGTSFTGNVTVALASNPTGATLGGTKTVAAIAGLATFSDLTLDRSGKGFTLAATANGLKTTVSSKFDIATSLVFTTEPVDAQPNTALAAVVVTVQDDAANTDTNYEGVVTLSKYTGPGSIAGTLSKAAVSGVATFSDLMIADDGTYSLMASAAVVDNAFTPASAISDDFTIAPYTVMFSSPASNQTIFTVAQGQGIPVTMPITINIINNTTLFGTLLGSGWNAGSTIKITNNGYLAGYSGGGHGAGGNGAVVNFNGSPGTSGGNALDLSGQTVTINNTSGNIWGGGGGGGGGGGARGFTSLPSVGDGNASGGSGGGSSGFASSGTIDSLNESASGSFSITTHATIGGNASGYPPVTSIVAGAGGLGTIITGGGGSILGGNGGAGGDWGQPGQAGIGGFQNTSSGSAFTGGAGGAAGKAINLNGGHVTFAGGNNPTQVKGAVS